VFRIAAVVAVVLTQIAQAPQQEPSTPLQYYSQALATMERLAEPAYVSFQTNVIAHGIGLAEPCDQGEVRWWLGFGSQMQGRLAWHATYTSANASEMIRTADGETCHGPAEAFDRPTWRDAEDWVRYGILSQGPNPAPQPTAVPTATTRPKTIADVSVIAPSAYWVTDGGDQRCPSGSAGHELHVLPRFDPAKHPLRDAVVETQSMRICMIRFDLGSYQAAGTGYRGDMQLDFGDVGGNWIVTRGHAAFAMRMAGLSLRTATLDFWYADVAFPTTAPSV
jgi:hypothetical protein